MTRIDNNPLPIYQPTECKQPAPLDGIKARPAFCECARTGKRPLSWASWIPGFSQNSILGQLNKEFAHEHIVFEQSQSDIGFGEHGLFSEDVATYAYRMESTCYDGELMRQAIEATPAPSWYGFIANNCQSYVERVLATYARLRPSNP